MSEDWIKHLDHLAESTIDASTLPAPATAAVDGEIIVNIDDIVPYQDIPPWRSINFTTHGKTKWALLANGHIFEVDEDGGDLRDYPLAVADCYVYAACVKAIDKVTK